MKLFKLWNFIRRLYWMKFIRCIHSLDSFVGFIRKFHIQTTSIQDRIVYRLAKSLLWILVQSRRKAEHNERTQSAEWEWMKFYRNCNVPNWKWTEMYRIVQKCNLWECACLVSYWIRNGDLPVERCWTTGCFDFRPFQLFFILSANTYLGWWDWHCDSRTESCGTMWYTMWNHMELYDKLGRMTRANSAVLSPNWTSRYWATERFSLKVARLKNDFPISSESE